MDEALLARLGLSRLHLPVPTGKLITVYEAAQLLRDEKSSECLWEALLGYVGELEFESEVLEALCIGVLARDEECVDPAEIQRAIDRPSPLSDLFLGEIYGQPLKFISWGKAHSGEAPPFNSADEILEELSSGRSIPGIFMSRFETLENESGHPFLNQWAYEVQRLSDRYGKQSDGEWEYFSQGEYGRGSGNFITRRGQLFRSAYLRTLALAFDCWNMPERQVYQESNYATPADFSFLRMLPGNPPTWSEYLNGCAPTSESDWQGFLEKLIGEYAKNSKDSKMLHFSLPLRSTLNYQADCELISCLHDEAQVSSEEAFGVHNFLLGNLKVTRTHNLEISLRSTVDISFPSSEGGLLYPALVPGVDMYTGYFHSDLIRRTPYLPANVSGVENLSARPRLGGMDILLNECIVGGVSYWNWRWSPTSDKSLGPHCGVCLSVGKEFLEELLSNSDSNLSRHWRATVLTRESDYGSWEEKTIYGSL